MELTPDAVRRVAFRESWRGYNQVDVDHFIEWVALGLEGIFAAEPATEIGDAADDAPPPTGSSSEAPGDSGAADGSTGLAGESRDVPAWARATTAASAPMSSAPTVPEERIGVPPAAAGAPPPGAPLGAAPGTGPGAALEEGAEPTMPELESAQGRLRAEVTDLERVRRGIEADIESLRRHLVRERARLRQVLTDAALRLDRELTVERSEPPETGAAPGILVREPSTPAAPRSEPGGQARRRPSGPQVASSPD